MASAPEMRGEPLAAVGAGTFNGDQALVLPTGDVTAVVRDADIALVSVHGSPTDGGELARAVLHVLAAHAVRTDLVSLCADSVMLTVPRADVALVPGFLELVLSASKAELTVNEDVAKVSLSGPGLVGDLHNVHRVVTALSSHAIQANWVFASPTHIAIIIAEAMLPEAIQVLQHTFELYEGGRHNPVN